LHLVLAIATLGQAPAEAGRVEIRKIWDRAPHNAFTDLIRFRDRWFCAFREGAGHVSPEASIRILTSTDGEVWEPAASVGPPGRDSRDPKLSITPDGRLMLVAALAPQGPGGKHQSFVAFSDDGREWTRPVDVGDHGVWLWRVTWHGDQAYGVGYGTGPSKLVRLYSSPDGSDFSPLVETLFDRGFPNESTLAFLPDDTALCLVRRDGEEGSAQLGRSRPPYRDWTWTDLGVRIGGPDVLLLPDGRLVAGVRLYDGKVRTALCWLDPEARKLTEFLTLPSGGDCSYPGLAWHEGRLWVSYYSSHDGKTSIYLARVELPARGAKPVESEEAPR
jgi:hypothetical protein